MGRRAAALGARVLGLRRGPPRAGVGGPEPDGVQVVHGPGGLRRLQEESDYLVLTAPETPETRGMVDRTFLAGMKEGAVLVNVARGGLVDQEALVEALRSGRLRGAGLDTFRQEPLPETSPLWGLPTVLVTPHVSAVSRGYWRRETDLVVANLERFLAGEPLENVVDRDAGY